MSFIKVVTIEKIGGEGVGIGKIDGKVVFVPNSVPGDVLAVKVYHETASYYKGLIVEIKKPSPDRIEAPCRFFGECGGCSHQNMSYETQLRYKHDLLREVYRKLAVGGVEVEPITPSPEEFRYRNKLQMQCSAAKNGKVGAGFYKVKSHDVVEIDECPLHSDRVNGIVRSTVAILNQFKIPPYSEKLKKGMVRHIVVRESRKTGEMLLTIVSKYPTLFNQNKISKALFAKNKSLKGFFVYHNPHDTNVIFEDSQDIRLGDDRSPLVKVFGEDYIVDSIRGTDFCVSPLSFFQVNTRQAENMADFIAEMLLPGGKPRPKVSLIDAYSGIGTLSLGLAPMFKSVMAIEIVSQACTLARFNSKIARARNYSVRRGDVPEVVGTLMSKYGEDDFRMLYPAMILDPPRAGLSEEMTDFLADVKVPELVYISCNPQTQARDANKLVAAGYEVKRIRPFDMFPHTFHTECIMKLEYAGAAAARPAGKRRRD